MILYKYHKLNLSRVLLRRPSVRFTRIDELNDPFEAAALRYDGSKNHEWNLMTLSQCYGVLSLSRNPLNSLMWSHYASGHKFSNRNFINLDMNNHAHAGMVIGIDVNEAGLNDESKNVLPAKFGSVIYTKTRPFHNYLKSDNYQFFEGGAHRFEYENLEAMQRVFLMKAQEWSYEEEVRVIRNTGRANKSFIENIERSAVKEIYFGMRNSYHKEYVELVIDKTKNYFPDAKVYFCSLKDDSWGLDRVDVHSHIISIDNQ